MTTYRLDTATAPATLDASGKATAFITPVGTEKWSITNYAVHVNQGLNSTVMPTCTLYTNSVDPSNQVDFTYTGASDAGAIPIHLEKGERLYVQWIGGIPGTQGTLSLYGTRELYK